MSFNVLLIFTLVEEHIRAGVLFRRVIRLILVIPPTEVVWEIVGTSIAVVVVPSTSTSTSSPIVTTSSTTIGVVRVVLSPVVGVAALAIARTRARAGTIISSTFWISPALIVRCAGSCTLVCASVTSGWSVSRWILRSARSGAMPSQVFLDVEGDMRFGYSGWLSEVEFSLFLKQIHLSPKCLI